MWWVDVTGRAVHGYEPVSGVDTTYRVEGTPTAIAPIVDGRLLIAIDRTCFAFDPSDGSFTPLLTLPGEPVTNRTNDGKCDAQGRLWIGTMARNAASHAGSLYRVDGDLTVHRVLSDTTISNGIAWSATGRRMFYVDSATRAIDAFSFDPETGQLTARQRLMRIPARVGEPDGVAIDAEDCVWVAIWGGAAVWRVDTRSGRVVDRISIPSTNVSSCAFGGVDLGHLYVTAAAPEPPTRGASLYIAPVAVPGIAVGSFGPLL